MTTEVVDFRKGDRFIVVEPLTGSFGATEVAVLNLSLGGVQISHPQPVRIGTRGKVWFRRGDISATVQGTVVWSQLTATSGGMVYKSGVKLDAADPQYALAVNFLVRSAVIRQDTDSLERKKQRMREREEQRKSQIRTIPTSERPPV
ncbi:MAG TPA: PilZ domain-containing protein [Thermoanaerobaculia bacterium]|nr:PilZ domain-containing protein [Thermoanaerobaculia bacterium]